MLRKALKHLLSSKYGLLGFILILITAAFFIGNWLGANQETTIIGGDLPVTAEEKAWREQGLLLDDGIYVVGSDIQPGIYRTKGSDTSLYGCRWQRLSGFGAENNNVVVSYSEDRGLPTIVAISPSDRGFKTEGCGKWYFESVPVTEDRQSFRDGAFIVGADITPGLYESPVDHGCYWERLGGLSRESYNGRLLGQDKELIAWSNDTLVEILPTDKGFISYNCKQWSRRQE
ncbi:hypothetical protein F4X86_00390 [Candidatus Saccharibacteria bacterium]|nr:hypothetical protein [Candidatus Saccharibacteria bacterium]